jgi:glycerol-3-phosphate acyltransferase PlsY
LLEILVLFISYFLGSIPSAYLAGRWTKKADIRQMGGGNMGALNATRELGGLIGGAVLLVDIAKGAAPILFAKAVGVSDLWVYAAGLVSIVGHCWPLFLKFRGGKGAATALGVCAALAPLPLLCALPIGLIVIWFTSNVTLGMASGFLFLPIFLWLFHQPPSLIVFTLLVILFLAVRYYSTAKRNFEKTGWRDFLIEKKYTPWQRPRRNPKK